MGLFDLPGPLLDWLDGVLGLVAPPTLRLIVWGLIGGAATMALYWLLSPQRAIAAAKTDAASARRSLDAYDGEFADAWPLIRRVLGQALRQLRLVLWPALVASLPAICLLVWISTAYGYSFPPAGAEVPIQTSPRELQAALVAPGTPPAAAREIVVADPDGKVISTIPWAAPIATIHKRQWWNLLFGNPAGYLPDDAAVERVELDLAPNEYLPFGPAWLRPWYGVFFTALVIGSLAVKLIWRIQ
jgi:hypothetical protein